MKLSYLITFLQLFLTISILCSQNLTVDEYIDKYKEIAIEEMQQNGVPASITLAQGILESANGNSVLAKEANNHFGIKCHNGWTGDYYYKEDGGKMDCFRKYKNAEESYRDHSQYLKAWSRYDFLFELKADDYKGWAYGLKKAGYATNPKYPELLINTIEKNNLTIFDNPNTKGNRRKNTDETSNKDAASDKGSKSIKDIQPIKEIKSKLAEKTPRTIINKNRLKAIIALQGDSWQKIAFDLSMFTFQLLRYNDLKEKEKDKAINEGDIIYLQAKRRKSDIYNHIFRPGEDLYTISQMYGIKLKFIYKYNKMTANSAPEPGQKIILRKERNFTNKTY